MQDQQNSDFKSVWSDLREDIVMVCSCGNHGEQNLRVVRLLTSLICFQSDLIRSINSSSSMCEGA
jgi:hypothetical protein